MTATDWQTEAKAIENSYNKLPLGCYYRRSLENVSILKILTPNLLKGKVASRAHSGLFEVTRYVGKIMEKVSKLFATWYQLWNNVYLPQILKRQKWFDSTESIIEEDIVIFNLRESEVSTEWALGKVDLIRVGRDGHARECVVIFKSKGVTDRILSVERPVREIIKLFNNQILENWKVYASQYEELVGNQYCFSKVLLDTPLCRVGCLG